MTKKLSESSLLLTQEELQKHILGMTLFNDLLARAVLEDYNGPLVKTTLKIFLRALGNTITMQLSHRNTPCQAPGSLMIHAALLCCIPQYIY